MSSLPDQNSMIDASQPTTGVASGGDKGGSPEKHGGMFWETVRYAIVAALIIIPIRTFVAQPFVVSGNSMLPTFKNGEYLIVNETAKYVGEYRRGDVVILRYPVDPSKYFIKRVIGLPGETVTAVDGAITVTGGSNATPLVLDEPYVKNAKSDNFSRTLASDEYFVMGDNRAQSSDSRVWGPVPKKLMDGKALMRLFPFNAIALHPGGVISYDALLEDGAANETSLN